MANYRLAELDFDDIKRNLKNFLSNYRDKENNLVFSDYDFEASSLSILLDILAYNTHYNAYLANMVANEMFLDSAVKRESAVSIAKHLGYTPVSFRSARARLDFTVPSPQGLPASLTLPKYTPFTTTIEGTIYTFVNLDTIIIKPENNQYRFNNVIVVEGEPLTYTYRVDLGGPQEKYVIPNKNVDISTIRVTVQNSFTDLTSSTFIRAEDIIGLNPESKIFFVEENTGGNYEILFGDGNIGQKLNSGNLVTIEYLVSSGKDCNVSPDVTQNFYLGVPLGGVRLDSPIVAVNNSSGGDIPDTIEEIKFKAPKFLSSYNRAVTANDYKAIISANYPLVESISVWGGEDNIPPLYGKVMISLKPYTGYAINDSTKNSILNDILSDKKMMSIIPEFVNPKYLFIQVDTTVKYDLKKSKYTPEQLQLLVRSEINKYFLQELQKFDKDFIYSQLSKVIDSTDISVIGNISTLKLQKRITPVLNALNGYMEENVINFSNELVPGSVRSTAFFFEDENNIIKTVYIKDVLTDNLASTLDLLEFTTNNVILKNIGTVDYIRGTLSIPSLKPIGYLENTSDIRIYSSPKKLDIDATKDLILLLDDTILDVYSGRQTGVNITITGI